MKFPSTNKVHRDLNESFGDNAKILEEKLRSVEWRFFLKFYAAAFGIAVLSLFVLIVVVRLALTI